MVLRTGSQKLRLQSTAGVAIKIPRCLKGRDLNFTALTLALNGDFESNKINFSKREVGLKSRKETDNFISVEEVMPRTDNYFFYY
jgi:hypothetical protein